MSERVTREMLERVRNHLDHTYGALQEETTALHALCSAVIDARYWIEGAAEDFDRQVEAALGSEYADSAKEAAAALRRVLAHLEKEK